MTGKSDAAPYIAEPVSEEAYRNVMAGLHTYLIENGSSAVGNATLGPDNWPTNEQDFFTTLSMYTSFTGPGSVYAQDVVIDSDGILSAYKVQSQYVSLSKQDRQGKTIDDANRQIDAMDATRAMVANWTDLQPAFPYSSKFITIEGFKVINRELYLNVGLAVVCVAAIVFLTVANPVTASLITINVGCCICEILGFMWTLGFAIDSVTVINLVLSVGLSVDYSAHVGHSFMVKTGETRNERVLEGLADVGSAVFAGGFSTFLAVAVLLFSDSYVFYVLSRQFCLTVVLGLAHGLILLPVLLSLFGPKPFSSAILVVEGAESEGSKPNDGKHALQHEEIVPMDQNDADGDSTEEGIEKESQTNQVQVVG